MTGKRKKPNGEHDKEYPPLNAGRSFGNRGATQAPVYPEIPVNCRSHTSAGPA